MPKTINLDTLEQDITGAYLAFLRKGGIEIDSLEAMTKVKHNTHDRALTFVFDTLFRPEKNQRNNQQSLLPYDSNEVLKQLVYIYYKLCLSTDNDCTIQGFCCMTGFEDQTIKRWSADELNPERCGIVKTLYEKRQGMIENKLSDHPIGTTALANNSASLGMMWARNNQPMIAQKAVYILPAEQTRKEIASGLPYEISKADTEQSA